MRDDAWLVLGLIGLCFLGFFVSSWLKDTVAAPGEADIAASLQASREANPAWPWDLIDAGTLQIGMSESMVLAALGTPDSTHESVDASGSHDEWVYSRADYSSVWILRRDGIDHRHKHNYERVDFENAIVTGWLQ